MLLGEMKTNDMAFAHFLIKGWVLVCRIRNHQDINADYVYTTGADWDTGVARFDGSFNELKCLPVIPLKSIAERFGPQLAPPPPIAKTATFHYHEAPGTHIWQPAARQISLRLSHKHPIHLPYLIEMMLPRLERLDIDLLVKEVTKS